MVPGGVSDSTGLWDPSVAGTSPERRQDAAVGTARHSRPGRVPEQARPVRKHRLNSHSTWQCHRRLEAKCGGRSQKSCSAPQNEAPPPPWTSSPHPPDRAGARRCRPRGSVLRPISRPPVREVRLPFLVRRSNQRTSFFLPRFGSRRSAVPHVQAVCFVSSIATASQTTD